MAPKDNLRVRTGMPAKRASRRPTSTSAIHAARPATRQGAAPRPRTTKARAGRAARPIRFAVVGLGYFAQAAVLPAFRHAKGAVLAALVSEDPQKLRELQAKYAVPIGVGLDGYDALLHSGDIDAVYLCVPNDKHCAYAVRAAKAGIHVLTEKPMALTPHECHKMVRAAKRNDVRLMVGYRLHFDPANLQAVEAVRSGRIGDPRYFVSAFSMQVKPGNIRLSYPRGGGPLYDIGIYCLNAARYLFGSEPLEVCAMTESGRDERFTQVDESVGVLMRFPEGRLACFIASFGAADVSRFSIVGTKGSITLDNAYEFHEPMTSEARVGETTHKRRYGVHDQVAPELEQFAAAIHSGTDPEPSGKEGLIDLEVIQAIQRAAAGGRQVLVGGPRRERRPTRAQERSYPAAKKATLVHAQAPTR